MEIRLLRKMWNTLWYLVKVWKKETNQLKNRSNQNRCNQIEADLCKLMLHVFFSSELMIYSFIQFTIHFWQLIPVFMYRWGNQGSKSYFSQVAKIEWVNGGKTQKCHFWHWVNNTTSAIRRLIHSSSHDITEHDFLTP